MFGSDVTGPAIVRALSVAGILSRNRIFLSKFQDISRLSVEPETASALIGLRPLINETHGFRVETGKQNAMMVPLPSPPATPSSDPPQIRRKKKNNKIYLRQTVSLNLYDYTDHYRLNFYGKSARSSCSSVSNETSTSATATTTLAASTVTATALTTGTGTSKCSLFSLRYRAVQLRRLPALEQQQLHQSDRHHRPRGA